MKKIQKRDEASHLDVAYAGLIPGGKKGLEKLLGRFAATLVIF